MFPPLFIAGSTAPSLLRLLTAGATFAVDGTATGTADSDGNVVISQLRDVVGTTHFGVSATTSKRPRQIPNDYLAGGRQSALLYNSNVAGQYQHFKDTQNHRDLWRPFYQAEASTGVTLDWVGMLTNDVANAQLFGNFSATAVAGGPGATLLVQPNGTLQYALWRTGVILVNASSAASAVPQDTFVHIQLVQRTDRTYNVYVNGVSVMSGTAAAGALVANLASPITIGSYSGTDGVFGELGGRMLFCGMWPFAKSAGELLADRTTATTWYANPAPAFDTGPHPSATVVSSAKIAWLGTSVEEGYNDAAESGAAGYINAVLEPASGDLACEWIGDNPGVGVRVMAVSGQTIRNNYYGSIGFDSISTYQAYRMDVQVASMISTGKIVPGETLVIVSPIGWLNDLRLGAESYLQYDHQGDLVRMLTRFCALIRAYSPNHDIRIVLQTCTPKVSGTVIRIPQHNAAIRCAANAIEDATATFVVCVNTHTPIAANTGLYMADDLHPNQAGHRLIAPLLWNGIRYACGRS